MCIHTVQAPSIDAIVDCGGYTGDSVYLLREMFDTNGQTPIHVFEPSPAHAHNYDRMPNVILHQKAVWITDGTIKLYLQLDNKGSPCSGMGSSIMREKTNVTDTCILVPCVDFSKWLMQTFPQGAHVVVKMNIEGAEYPVLWKMADDGAFSRVYMLYVQFHHEKYPQLASRQQYQQLIARVPLPIQEWDRDLLAKNRRSLKRIAFRTHRFLWQTAKRHWRAFIPHQQAERVVGDE